MLRQRHKTERKKIYVLKINKKIEEIFCVFVNKGRREKGENVFVVFDCTQKWLHCQVRHKHCLHNTTEVQSHLILLKLLNHQIVKNCPNEHKTNPKQYTTITK